jgi:large subunit ribosomal protein L11
MQIKLLVEGGNMQPGPSLSQKIGPLGLNMGQIIQKINEATKNFKGMKVPVELEINTSTKEFNVKVFSPPVSELLKKELNLEKGSGEHKKFKVANASIEQIIYIAKSKLPNMLSKDLKSAVKSVLGSCVSLGILVENKDPKEVIKEVDKGVYDREISQEIIETPKEKKQKLQEFFSLIVQQQEKIRQQEEAAKAALETSTKKTATQPTATQAVKTETKKQEEKQQKPKK